MKYSINTNDESIAEQTVVLVSDETLFCVLILIETCYHGLINLMQINI